MLFDCDGVLVDSGDSIHRNWRAWSRKRGLAFGEIAPALHGRRSADVIRLVAPWLDAEAEAVAIDDAHAMDESVRAVPGAASLLHRLRHERIGVVTSGSARLARTRLRAVGLPVPSTLVTAEDVAQGKPHPEGYLIGAHGLGLRSRQVLAVEDAPAGIEAARAAGMTAVAVVTTHPRDALSAADHVIGSIRDLPALLDHIAPASPVACALR